MGGWGWPTQWLEEREYGRERWSWWWWILEENEKEGEGDNREGDVEA